MGQRVICCSELNLNWGGVEKSSLNRAIVAVNRPETGRSIRGPGGGEVTITGGPNPPMLKNLEVRS